MEKITKELRKMVKDFNESYMEIEKNCDVTKLHSLSTKELIEGSFEIARLHGEGYYLKRLGLINLTRLSILGTMMNLIITDAELRDIQLKRQHLG